MSRLVRALALARAALVATLLASFVSACSAPGLRQSSTVPPDQAVGPGAGGGARSAGGAPGRGSEASRRGGYYLDDGPGDAPPPDLGAIADAVPRSEPIAARASRPYVVFERQYVPMTALVPFRERGLASWYGRRYHGQRTSIGEVYDMYAMTGAHPTLPLPSYVRVTHLGNGRSVVVRLNDRGPFLGGRVIDLSYVAAAKLGYVNAGSAEVEVELITQFDSQPAQLQASATPVVAPVTPTPPVVAPVATSTAPSLASAPAPAPARLEFESVVAPGAPASGAYFLQLGAFSSVENALAARGKVAQAASVSPARLAVRFENGLHKLHYGPFGARGEALAEAQRIRALGGGAPFVVDR